MKAELEKAAAEAEAQRAPVQESKPEGDPVAKSDTPEGGTTAE